MVRCPYRFGAEILAREDGRHIGSVDLPPIDWGSALQWAQWQGVRSDDGPPLLRCVEGRVEPRWDAEAGQPFVSSLTVRTARPGGEAAIPTRYVRAAVEAAAAGLVTDGRLREGEAFLFRLFAVPDDRRRLTGEVQPDDFEIIDDAVPVLAASLADAAAGSTETDEAHADPVDVPVLIPAAVLEASTAAAAAAPSLETGGVLVGHLCRDPETRAYFVAVTARLPAHHVIATADRLTFTADTWSDAHATLALRGRAEIHVGWVHSHPYPCGACAPEAQARCTRSAAFLSLHDIHLHRTIFARAFDVALLVADRGPRGFETALYGWRRGLLERRAYRVTDGAIAIPESARS